MEQSLTSDSNIVKLEFPTHPNPQISFPILNECVQSEVIKADMNMGGGDILIEEKFIPDIPGPSRNPQPEMMIGAKKFLYCNLCDKYFASPAYSVHIKGCQDYFQIKNEDCRNSCPIEGCNDKFKSQKNLQRHMRNTHAENYECQFCGVKFRILKRKEEHLIRIHPNEAGIKKESIPQKSKLWIRLDGEDGSKERKMYNCTRYNCQAKFESEGMLERHDERVHQRIFESDCPVCFQTISHGIPAMLRHLKTHKTPGTNKRRCCGMFFKHKLHVRAHMKSEIHRKITTPVQKMNGNKEAQGEEFILPDQKINPIDELLIQYKSRKNGVN